MARAPYEPTAAELAGAHSPFLYELEMLRGTTDAFIQHLPLLQDLTVMRAFLESALVHARNLLDFFTCDPNASDDILAAHFVPASDGKPWKPSGLRHLTSRRVDINKALSHRTYARSLKKPRWDFPRMRVEIDDAYAQFLRLLPDATRDRWQA